MLRINLTPVESSQIHSIGHDAASNTLAIRFKNSKGDASGLYHYDNFTATDFAAFSGAESIGSHFGKHIKKETEKHPFRKVDESQVDASFQSGFICITGVDMRAFIKAVYELSVPQGMGFLHFTAGDMTAPVLDQLIAEFERDKTAPVALRLDYVEGRACKMTVFRDTTGQLHIFDRWYDHSITDLISLLDSVGVSVPLKLREAA